MVLSEGNIYTNTSAQFVWRPHGVQHALSKGDNSDESLRSAPKSLVQVSKDTFSLEPQKNTIDGVPGPGGGLLLEVGVAGVMETATIEQIHRYKQLHFKHVDRLPAIRKLSRDQGLAKTCAFKEFRFEPPFVSRRREKRRKKLPPIPENMLPKRHNSIDEELTESLLTDAPTLPSLSISPAFITEKPEERSLSVEATGKSPQPGLYQSREFTFPESNSKRKKQLPNQPSIVPAMTPRVRDIPLQARIEKLAKQKRKERAKRTSDRRYEKKHHNMMDPPAAHTHMAFRSRREPEATTSFNLKEHKQLPFKQMGRSADEPEKSRLPPRLYTKIVDSIYSYTKGAHGGGGGNSRGSYERLMVTPVTAKEDVKDDLSRQLSVLPPIG